MNKKSNFKTNIFRFIAVRIIHSMSEIDNTTIGGLSKLDSILNALDTLHCSNKLLTYLSPLNLFVLIFA